jgi:pseudaminic acid biosynthesis-associated methylase
MNFKTEQESFWAGTFGKDYIKRNNSEQLLSSKVALWARMLRSAHGVGSIREFGCNIGLNLLALKRLRPDLALSGIEINKTAADEAAALGVAEIRNGTILDPVADGPVDLTFTSGVLIHINPEFLEAVYDNLVTNSRRYVLVAEYYNPVPTSVPYRGHADRLFKRDFAGDLIDRYGLKLLDYGFVYKRDSWCPQDDVTWFLLEKG